MHILVTNDDGVTAPGLDALAEAMQALGRVSVIAPDRNWSASGHVKTMHKPLRAHETRLFGDIEAYATNGAPSDCVALALLGLLSDPIDLVVSGINPRANLGHDVTYSGTVTAAMEAVIGGVQGVAVSCENADTAGYDVTAQVALRVSRAVAEHGLPASTLLNVNVPALAEDQIKGTLVTRMDLRAFSDHLVHREDPNGRPYYWIGGARSKGTPAPGTDYAALGEGYVSVTPLTLDLTAGSALEAVKAWNL